jgi:type II secretory pathway predicted ATPase ExeA
MTLTKMTTDVNNITVLDDAPALTASELKAKFDQAGSAIKTYLNETLTDEMDTAIGTIPEIVDDLTSGGTDKAASAETVKTLNTDKQDAISVGADEPSGGADGDIYLRYS